MNRELLYNGSIFVQLTSLLQVSKLCDLQDEADSVTSVSWSERVRRLMNHNLVPRPHGNGAKRTIAWTCIVNCIGWLIGYPQFVTSLVPSPTPSFSSLAVR